MILKPNYDTQHKSYFLEFLNSKLKKFKKKDWSNIVVSWEMKHCKKILEIANHRVKFEIRES